MIDCALVSPPAPSPTGPQPSDNAPPPPPPPPPPPINVLQTLPPPLPTVPPFSMSGPMMVTIQNDCGWHTTNMWSGSPWPACLVGYIAEENVVMNASALENKLRSLRGRLFWNSSKGWQFFETVVTQRFRAGHAHIKFMATTGKYLGVELSCARCCRYTCIEVNPGWESDERLDVARATLLSYITGCEYFRPGSGGLRQS